MSKKYISKISKDGETIYVKDSEARDLLPELAAETDVRALVEDIIIIVN